MIGNGEEEPGIVAPPAPDRLFDLVIERFFGLFADGIFQGARDDVKRGRMLADRQSRGIAQVVAETALHPIDMVMPGEVQMIVGMRIHP